MLTRTVENVAGAWGVQSPTRRSGAAVKNGNGARAKGRAARRYASTRIEGTAQMPVRPARTDGMFAEHTESWPVTSDAYADNQGYERNARESSSRMRWDSAVSSYSRPAGLQRGATGAPVRLGPGP